MSIECGSFVGRLRQCKTSVGGAKTFFVGLWSDFAGEITQGGTSQTINLLPAATLHRFEVDPASGSLQMTSAITASPENGTVFYAHSVVARLKKISAPDRIALQNITASQVVVFVLDNNGNLFMCGYANGADVTAGNLPVTGNALGDMSGYEITFTANEPESPIMAVPFTTVPFDNFVNIVISPAY